MLAAVKRKQRKRRPSGRAAEPVGAPPPLKRAPRTDLEAHITELDRRTFAGVDAAVVKLRASLERSQSLDEMRLLATKSQLLAAMKGTHRSIGQLVGREGEEPELAVDALPLTRVQLERCFLALLIEDRPQRWHIRYRKNAWKTFAEKFFRDQQSLGHLEPFGEYFSASGPGVSTLRAFAREMDVWEDELQTLRAETQGDQMDPRWGKRHIADMPTPAKAVGLLDDPSRKALAELVYPYYSSLSHFTHGGLAGVMQAAILRGEAGAGEGLDIERFFRSSILEVTLPLSYVALLLVATLFAPGLSEDGALRRSLIQAWRPYHSDGSPLGVAVWDAWAAPTLGAGDEQAT
jgi:hypothetical protein